MCREEISIRLCPAMRVNTQVLQSDSPSQTRNVCHTELWANGHTGVRLFSSAVVATSSKTLACYFLGLDTSTSPLRVGAGQMRPSTEFAARRELPGPEEDAL